MKTRDGHEVAGDRLVFLVLGCTVATARADLLSPSMRGRCWAKADGAVETAVSEARSAARICRHEADELKNRDEGGTVSPERKRAEDLERSADAWDAHAERTARWLAERKGGSDA